MSVGLQVYQNVVRCVRRSSGVSEGTQVWQKVLRCQNVFKCGRGTSGVAEGHQLCQKVDMYVGRLLGVLVGCQVCQ